MRCPSFSTMCGNFHLRSRFKQRNQPERPTALKYEAMIRCGNFERVITLQNKPPSGMRYKESVDQRCTSCTSSRRLQLLQHGGSYQNPNERNTKTDSSRHDHAARHFPTSTCGRVWLYVRRQTDPKARRTHRKLKTLFDKSAGRSRHIVVSTE